MLDCNDKPVVSPPGVDLPLSPAEAQTVFRALIDYRRILQTSAIRDSALVRPEIDRVDVISERLSLGYFLSPAQPTLQGVDGGDR